jgi:DNA-binding HxlR family transcriptional regulator
MRSCPRTPSTERVRRRSAIEGALALSKQLSTLEEAGYVVLARPTSGRARHVRVRLTDAGRGAFEGHVQALRAITNGASAPGGRSLARS